MTIFAKSSFVRIELFTESITTEDSVRLRAFGTQREEPCRCENEMKLPQRLLL